MRKSPKTREAARALVSPLFAWSNAMLKGGEMMLDSMQAAATQVRKATVDVIPTADAPARRGRSKAGSRKRKAKSRRR
jgi:hypothetical protein